MTEASAGGGGRAEIERTIVQRSLQDEDFRRRLLDDPKAAVEQELGKRLPEGVQVRVVEETAETIYLVLPGASPVGEGGELSDEELQSAAGGRRPGAGRGRRSHLWSRLSLLSRLDFFWMYREIGGRLF